MNLKTVSIIIPTYNRAHLIADTLNSVINQFYKNWECIIVDDSSTDGTKELMEHFIEKDKRFIYKTNERVKGAQGARNTGLIYSGGESIVFFDSDNIMYENYLSFKVKYLEDHPLIDICTSYSHVLNDEKTITGLFSWVAEGDILKGLLKGETYVDFNSALIRKKVIDKMGFLDEQCPSFQEYDTHLMLSQFSKYGTVHQILTGYFRRNAETISSDVLKDFQGFFYVLKKHRQLWLENTGMTVYKKRLRELNDRALKLPSVDISEIKKAIPEFSSVNRQQKIKKYLKWVLQK